MPLALIVDEPSKFRAMLCAELAAELDTGEALETDGVREGFRLAREHRPGLVLVDVERFGNSGIDFVRRVSAMLPTVPVLVCPAPTPRRRRCGRGAPARTASWSSSAAWPK